MPGGRNQPIAPPIPHSRGSVSRTHTNTLAKEPGSHSLAVLVSFSAVINLTKSSLGEEWVYLTYRLQSVVKGSKGRNSRQRRSPELKQRLEEGSFPACFLCLPQLPFLCSLGHLHRDGTAHSRLAPHIAVSCVKKMPYRHGHRQAP